MDLSLLGLMLLGLVIATILIELLVERKEDVSKRGSGMRLWRRPVAPGPILGLATE